MMKKPLIFSTLFMFFAAFAAIPEFQVTTLAAKGEPRKSALRKTAETFAARLSRTLKRKIAVVPFEKADAKTVFLITREDGVDKSFSKPLSGKFKDSFVITYPVAIKGKKNICLLMCRDRYAYGYAGNYFLRKYLGVDQVGPGEKLGWIFPDNSKWQMPEKISEVMIPDFNTRNWTTNRAGSIDLEFYLAASRRNIAWHSFGTIIPPKKYGKTHPEYYPLIKGKRFIYYANPHAGWQPCVSNRDFQALCVDYLIRNEKKDAGDGASFGVNDGAGNCCECKDCLAMDDPAYPGDYSKRFFTFYKQVLDKAREKRPELKARVLLYGANTNRIPKDVPIHPGIIGMGMNYTDFEGFIKQGLKHAGLWDHQMDIRYPTVRHYPAFLSKRLKMLRKMGVKEYFSEMYPIPAAGAPKQYILARILWDVDTDPDAVMTEYCTKAFGPGAAPHVKAYFEQWEIIYQREKDDLKSDVNVPSYGIEKFVGIRPGDMEKMSGFLKKAAKQKMTSEQKQRLDIVSTYFEYLRCLADRYLLAKQLREEKNPTPEQINTVVIKAKNIDRNFEKLAQKISGPENLYWYFSVSTKTGKVDLSKDLIYKRYRDVVENYLMESSETALLNVEKTACKGMTKAAKLKFWQKTAEKYPEITAIAFRIAANSGPAKNYIRNGQFKEGKAGDPKVRGSHPQLAHWYFYEQVGLGTSDDFKSFWNWTKVKGWSNNLCFGRGKYPEIRQYMYLPAGIYRLSARRAAGGTMNFSVYEAGNLKKEFLKDTNALRRMRFTELLLSYNHMPGKGNQTVSQLVTVKKSGYHAILIAVPNHKSERYARLMDVKMELLVKFSDQK